MAGIYLHIPFCKQKCHYCDFHFSTSLKRKSDMVESICKEMELQRHYLAGHDVSTVYFGGGTPSLLTADELHLLFDTLARHFSIASGAEITLEANPDDLTPERVRELAQSPVNRLSIGIQSFHEEHLRLMNRAHNATEAATCVQLAQEAGFSNISIDLIYGVPAPDHSIWQQDMQLAFALGVQHISSYALTIEPNTAFGRWSVKGKFTQAEEEFVAEQFEQMLDQMRVHGFEQYEISNFALPGFYSRHNSNYWRGVPYLGLGPSAHSFSGTSRQHNVANNALYMQAIQKGELPAQEDVLSTEDQVNEYILTSLRTSWGTNLQKLMLEYHTDLLQVHRPYIQKLQDKGLLRLESNTLYLTDAGKLLADKIAADLFV